MAETTNSPVLLPPPCEPAFARFLAYCGIAPDSPEAKALDAQFDVLGLMVGEALVQESFGGR